MGLQNGYWKQALLAVWLNPLQPHFTNLHATYIYDSYWFKCNFENTEYQIVL